MRTKRMTLSVAEARVIRDILVGQLQRPLDYFDSKGEENFVRRIHDRCAKLVNDVMSKKAISKI